MIYRSVQNIHISFSRNKAIYVFIDLLVFGETLSIHLSDRNYSILHFATSKHFLQCKAVEDCSLPFQREDTFYFLAATITNTAIPKAMKMSAR